MTEAEWLACTELRPMLEFLRGKASDRQLRLFAVACCRRIWDLLTFECSREAVETADLHADGLVASDDRARIFTAAAREAICWTNCHYAGSAIGYAASAAAYALANQDTLEADVIAAGAQDLVGLAEAVHDAVGYSPVLMTALETTFAAGSALVAYLDEQERFAAGDKVEEVEAEAHIIGAGSAYLELAGIDPAAGEIDFRVAFESIRRAEAEGQRGLLADIVGNPFQPASIDPRWRTLDAVSVAQGIYDDRAFDRLPILGDALMDAGCNHEEILAHCRSRGPHVKGCWVVDLLLGK